jgi:hypothetical protein
MKTEWQDWTDELAEKTADARELDHWIESLKSKNP